MADKVGFEPTDAPAPTVFKTVPINLTLAPVLMLILLAVGDGIEPPTP
mgnify:FL=1